MVIELSYLSASVALFGAMIFVQALFSNLEHKLGDLAGSRDGIIDNNPRTMRAKRANQNMIEGLLLFAPLVLIAAQSGRLSETTALGTALFFWGRVAYAPLYWFGVPWLRTVAWTVSLLGILLVFSEVLPFSGGA